MVSRVQRYFLELKDFSNTIDLNLPANYQILLENDLRIHLHLNFYRSEEE